MKKNNKNTHFYYFRAFYLQLLAVFLTVIGVYLYGASSRFLQSVLAAGLVMSLNVGVLCWLLKNMIQKKVIAFSVIVIVFKWAILAISIYVLIKHFEVIGVMVGLTTILPGFLLWLIAGNPFKERE